MKRNFIPYIYILFFILVFQKIQGQKFELKVVANDIENSAFLKSVKFQNFHDSKESIANEIDSISLNLSKIGFLENHIDSIQKKDSLSIVFFKLGRNSNSIVINYVEEDLDLELLKLLNINSDKNQITTTINQVPSILNNIIVALEESGNSFSEVSLQNISKSKNGIIAYLQIDRSSYRTIDNIIVKGYENFPKSFLKYYLDLKTSSVFNSNKLIEISTAVNSLNFASEIKSPEVLFSKDSTTIYLYLQKNKSNKFDGLIGFSTDESGKLNFNGYLDLKLNNVFNKGESLSIYWKGNGAERKVFNFEVNAPFIFGSPISPKATFNIYKQDSTFLTIKTAIDAAVIINSKNSIAALFQAESSNDLSEIVQTNTISAYKNNFYGLSYTFHQPDLNTIFQNKFYITINTLWGSRTITDNNKKEHQEKYELQSNYIWSLNPRNSIFIQNTSGILFSNELFTNELYRIGGANSIRGFNEESIFSSAFSILNVEYRYSINPTSYLYSITDFGFSQNDVSKTATNLYSFGLGYSYGTTSGIVNLSYAIGNQENIPFEFKNSQFHIKLIQYF